MWTVLGTWWRGLAITSRERRPCYYASGRQREELAQHFFAAAEQGDLPALEALLAQGAAR